MLYIAERVSGLHRKTKGDVTEAYLTARLLELGYTVLKPVGDNARYDLVIERGGCFHRVQCKTATWGDEEQASLVFAACSTNWHLRDGKRGYHGEADFFGVYFPPSRKVYLVPVAVCGHTEIRLRITPPRNGQVRGIRYAVDYEI
jgi:hypothetical protein